MIRFLRPAFAIAAALLLTAVSPTFAAAPMPPSQWAQAHSDITADPDIRFGTLSNGMRYAIRKQSIPPGQAAVSRWNRTGSLMETDAQAGLSH